MIKGTSGTKREENFKWYIRSVRDWKRAVRRLERRLGKKECKNDD